MLSGNSGFEDFNAASVVTGNASSSFCDMNLKIESVDAICVVQYKTMKVTFVVIFVPIMSPGFLLDGMKSASVKRKQLCVIGDE
jgi:hypothetical protein